MRVWLWRAPIRVPNNFDKVSNKMLQEGVFSILNALEADSFSFSESLILD